MLFVQCVTHSIHNEYCIITKSNGQKQSKFCMHVKYHNHQEPSKRRPCNMVLMKMVKCKGSESLVLFKYFLFSYTISNIVICIKIWF